MKSITTAKNSGKLSEMSTDIQFFDDKLQEECGVIGMIEPEGEAIDLFTFALAFGKLQTRGQDMWGITTSGGYQKELFRTRIQPGKIATLVDDPEVQAIFKQQPNIVIGHNRYATKGRADQASTFNGQPFVTDNLAGAHNGNDERFQDLKSKTELIVDGESDTAWIISYMAQELKKYPSAPEMLVEVLPNLSSSYSMILNLGKMLIAVRDPWGNRPLCYGRTVKSGWIIASESTSITESGSTYIREIQPGEMVIFYPDSTCQSIIFGNHPYGEQKCVLEDHYFSRPSSYDGEHFIYEQRQALGAGAALRFAEKSRQNNIHIDCVIPILNSGKYAAKGAANSLHVPIYEAIQLQGPEVRSFIEKNEMDRVRAVENKHVLLPDLLHGRSILLVDDSIVRGTSLRSLIKRIHALKETNQSPSHIHILISSPPVISPCDLGVNISSEDELLVAKWKDLPLDEIEQKVADFLNVDSVTYSTPEIVSTALNRKQKQMCDRCFGGQHPVKERPEVTYLAHHHNVIRKLPAVLYVSDKKFAPHRPPSEKAAPKLKIVEVNVHDFRSKKAVTEILKVFRLAPLKPPMIMLGGWRSFLTRDELKTLLHELPAKTEVILVEHALLDAHGGAEIQTSSGKVPQLRVSDQVAEAFVQAEAGRMFTTGITVFKAKLKDNWLSATKLLRQEIGIRPNEDIHQLQERVYRAEEQAVSVVVQQFQLGVYSAVYG